jgi:hypothetical protein
MPDKNGQLTDPEQAQVLAWLQTHEKGRPRVCPICASTTWTLGQHVVHPVLWRPNSFSMGGPAYPQIMLISEPCGYTIFLNAVTIGMFPQSPQSKE